jgi:hypothetical protein
MTVLRDANKSLSSFAHHAAVWGTHIMLLVSKLQGMRSDCKQRTRAGSFGINQNTFIAAIMPATSTVMTTPSLNARCSRLRCCTCGALKDSAGPPAAAWPGCPTDAAAGAGSISIEAMPTLCNGCSILKSHDTLFSTQWCRQTRGCTCMKTSVCVLFACATQHAIMLQHETS